MRGGALRGWRQVHRWTSIVCSLFLLMLCLTGLPLVFADEIEGLGKGSPAPLPPGAAAPSLDEIVADALSRHPGARLRNLVLDRDDAEIDLRLSPTSDAPWDETSALSYDARSGALLHDGTRRASALIALVLTLHRDMFVGLPGELFLGAMGLAFLVALVSGVVLYAPFMRRLGYGEIRRSGSRRLRMLDLHNLTGMTVAAWMLVVGASGVMNTLSTPLFGFWIRRDVSPVLAALRARDPIVPSIPVSAAIAAARRSTGLEPLFITFPTHIGGGPLHEVVWMAGRTKLGSRMMTPVLVDARDGHVELVGKMPWYLRALELSRPLHFGDYGGIVLKLLWAASDLVAIYVLGGGIYLLFSRRPLRTRAPEEARLVGGEA